MGGGLCVGRGGSTSFARPAAALLFIAASAVTLLATLRALLVAFVILDAWGWGGGQGRGERGRVMIVVELGCVCGEGAPSL